MAITIHIYIDGWVNNFVQSQIEVHAYLHTHLKYTNLIYGGKDLLEDHDINL